MPTTIEVNENANPQGPIGIILDGPNELITLGHSLTSNNPKKRILIDGSTANVYAGGGDKAGDILVRNKDGNERIQMDGQIGDIILQNADCAEEFDISRESTRIEPGTVMVMNSHGAPGIRKLDESKIALRLGSKRKLNSNTFRYRSVRSLKAHLKPGSSTLCKIRKV